LRVSVFDPHPVVHKGLTSQLPRAGFSVVSQALDGRNAVAIVRQARADIVITELRMPHADGWSVLESLDIPGLDVPALVYTTDANPSSVARAIACGARDYVFKTDPVDKLVTALREIRKPDSACRNQLFVSIRDKMQSRDREAANSQDLTSRELQVLRHLGLGLSNREIARSLEISVETVKEHVQNILRKLDSRDRTEAAVLAVRDGLV
jgi:DNA-binding NarL/FixJ family response regulator